MLRLLKPPAALRGVASRRNSAVQFLVRGFGTPVRDPSEDAARFKVLMDLQMQGSELLEKRLSAAHRQVISESQALWKRRSEVLAGAPLTEEELELQFEDGELPESLPPLDAYWPTVLVRELRDRGLDSFLNEMDESVLETLVDVHLACEADPSGETSEELNTLTVTFSFQADTFFAPGGEVLSVAFLRKGSELVSTTGCNVQWREGFDPTKEMDDGNVGGPASKNQPASSFFRFFAAVPKFEGVLEAQDFDGTRDDEIAAEAAAACSEMVELLEDLVPSATSVLIEDEEDLDFDSDDDDDDEFDDEIENAMRGGNGSGSRGGKGGTIGGKGGRVSMDDWGFEDGDDFDDYDGFGEEDDYGFDDSRGKGGKGGKGGGKGKGSGKGGKGKGGDFFGKGGGKGGKGGKGSKGGKGKGAFGKGGGKGKGSRGYGDS